MKTEKLVPYIVLAIIILGVLFLLANRAEAGTATVTWTNATIRTDGSPFPLTSLASTKVEWGTCSGTAFGTIQGSQTLVGTGTSLTLPNLAPATYCFRAIHMTTTNITSAYSNVASKVVMAPAEVPPVSPTITVVIVVP